METTATETKRPRSDIREIRTWEDVDVALGILRTVDARTATINADHDVKIQAIQEAKQKAIQPYTDKRDRIAAMLEAFVRANRPTLGKKPEAKSRKLVHGVVGFKKGNPKLVFVQPEEAVKRLLKMRGHLECVVTTEEVKKDAVKALPPTEQALCGVRVDQGEDFYYKLNTDEPVEYPDVGGDGAS